MKRTNETMVSASNGYIILKEAKKKKLFLTKSRCLACKRKHITTANSFNPYICYECKEFLIQKKKRTESK